MDNTNISNVVITYKEDENNEDIDTDIKENKDSETLKSITVDFDTLVLSGGSVQALLMLGALQYSEDKFLLRNVDKYVGTSAGAMCGYLLAIGYTPIEIIVFICTNQILEKMKHLDIYSMVRGNGATSFSYIHEKLEKMTIEKIGHLITLKELYTKYKKVLYCVTHNLTKGETEILSHETHPDLPCLVAIRMTSNLPFIFDHFKYMDCYYVDGWFANNFPIDIGDKIGNKILGISLDESKLEDICEKKDKIVEYLYHLTSISTTKNTLNNINNSSDKCKVIRLKAEKRNFFDFDLSVNTRLEMFSNGYNQMKTYWEK